jgi:hypothetical protein
VWIGFIALAFLLTLAWAIARISRRAGFGSFGTALPFGTLFTAFMVFFFQEQLGFPMSDTSNTVVMSVVMAIWAAQLISIAIRQWPALFDDSGEDMRS